MRTKIIFALLLSSIGSLLISSCGLQGEYQLPVIPISVSVNAFGSIKVSISGSFVTPIGTFSLIGNTTIYEIGEQFEHRILIVRLDNEATVYEIGKDENFEVSFESGDNLFKKVNLEYQDSQNIVLHIESSAFSTLSWTGDDRVLSGDPEIWLPQYKDFPENWAVLYDRELTNSEIAQNYVYSDTVLASFTSWRRITSYQKLFLAQNICDLNSGLLDISVQAIVFRDSEGARQNWNFTVDDHRAGDNTEEITHQFDTIGEKFFVESGKSQSTCVPPHNTIYFGVVFQSYNAMGYVHVVGIDNDRDYKEFSEIAISYAKIIEKNFIAYSNIEHEQDLIIK